MLLFEVINIILNKFLLINETWFQLARKKKTANRKFLSQLVDFDQDFVIGDAVSCERQNDVVNNSLADREFSFKFNDHLAVTIENTVVVQTMLITLTARTAREMGNAVETVEDRIQNAILAAMDNVITPRIELALRSLDASSGQEAASVTSTLDRREQVGLLPLLRPYPLEKLHFMNWIWMMRLEVIALTK